MLGLFCPSQAYADVVMIYDNQAMLETAMRSKKWGSQKVKIEKKSYAGSNTTPHID